jgi:hypothetical protein
MKAKKGFKCCICGLKKMGWGENQQFGNNPAPYDNTKDAQCCDSCNRQVVIPARIATFLKRNKEEKKND